jgi:hypothetical protein
MVSQISWTSPRTWVSGEVPTAAILNTHLRDQLLELNGTASAWTAFTPTFGGIVASAPSGRYKQIGKTVLASASVAISSISGAIAMAPPVTPHASAYVVGTAVGVDQGVGYYIGLVIVVGGSFLIISGGTTFWQPSVPFAWGATDAVILSLTYEAA